MRVPSYNQLRRTLLATGASVTLLAGGTCITGRQFREAALPSIQSGVGLILDGMVDGVFAAIEVETPSSTDDTSSSGQ